MTEYEDEVLAAEAAAAAEADAWLWAHERGWEDPPATIWLSSEQRNRLGVVDLSETMQAGIAPTRMLTPRIVAGAPTIWFGPGGEGKTFILLHDAVEVLNHGGQVVWVDKESGQVELSKRLGLLGVDPAVVRAQLTYLHYPTMDFTHENVLAWDQLIRSLRPTLVAVDAYTEVLSDADVQENDNSGLQRWFGAYGEPVLRAGGALVLLDHVGHEQGGRPRGQTHKSNRARVTIRFEKTMEFGPDEIGEVVLTTAKNNGAAPLFDREGLVGDRQAYRVGGLDGHFIFAPKEASIADAVQRDYKTERDEELRQKIVAVVREHGPQLSRRQILQRVDGAGTTAKENAMTGLAANEARYGIQVEAGPNRSQLFTYVGGEQDAPPLPTLPHHEPEGGDAT